MAFLTITDTIQEQSGITIREQTIALFGAVVCRRIECYPIQKEKTIGFTGSGNSLTYEDNE